MLACVLSGFLVSAGWAQTDPPPPGPPPILGSNANYNIEPPPPGNMVQVSTNPSQEGLDDNLVWSHSGRLIASDRNSEGQNKIIYVLDLTDMGNIQEIGARSDNQNPVFPNITDWTWNDDRVLFGCQRQPPQKTRIMSCTITGAMTVAEFLSDPSGALHVFSPSVIFDPIANKERLLFLTSTSTNLSPFGAPETVDPSIRINVCTVSYAPGGKPNWDDRKALTSFTTTNVAIQSAKWCPELGTNFQPLLNRYAIVKGGGPGGGQTNPPLGLVQDPPPGSQPLDGLQVFSGVKDILYANAAPPTSLADSRFEGRAPGSGSQMSWTYDGVFMMYAAGNVQLVTTRSAGTNTAQVEFAVPTELEGQQLQWLCISPDGTRVAFTANRKIYMLPMQFENMVIAGTSNILSDGGYTRVIIPGGAVNSNCTINIMNPNTVDTNNFPGAYVNGSARDFAVQGFSNFVFNTNVQLNLHFSSSDLPPDAAETNLAIFVYDSTNVVNGHTGAWTQVSSTPDTTNKFVAANVTHFSRYAIGVPSDGGGGSELDVTDVTGDYDGDGKADPALYQESTGTWYVKLSASGYVLATVTLGGSGYNPARGDFDGDRKTDPAVYQSLTGNWTVKLSASGYATVSLTGFGGADYESNPIPGDFDGDGKADLALYSAVVADATMAKSAQESTGIWLVKLSASGYATVTLTGFGGSGYEPEPGDFDGDGKADPALFQESTSTWYVKLSGSDYVTASLPDFGGNHTVTGDFDGDGKTDFAIYHATAGTLEVKLSASGYATATLSNFGGSGYYSPSLAMDYDGDGKADPALYQASTAKWFVWLSASGYAVVSADSGYTP